VGVGEGSGVGEAVGVSEGSGVQVRVGRGVNVAVAGRVVGAAGETGAQPARRRVGRIRMEVTRRKSLMVFPWVGGIKNQGVKLTLYKGKQSADGML
jgi:hypothetical protein